MASNISSSLDDTRPHSISLVKQLTLPACVPAVCAERHQHLSSACFVMCVRRCLIGHCLSKSPSAPTEQCVTAVLHLLASTNKCTTTKERLGVVLHYKAYQLALLMFTLLLVEAVWSVHLHVVHPDILQRKRPVHTNLKTLVTAHNLEITGPKGTALLQLSAHLLPPSSKAS